MTESKFPGSVVTPRSTWGFLQIMELGCENNKISQPRCASEILIYNFMGFLETL